MFGEGSRWSGRELTRGDGKGEGRGRRKKYGSLGVGGAAVDSEGCCVGMMKERELQRAASILTFNTRHAVMLSTCSAIPEL